MFRQNMSVNDVKNVLSLSRTSLFYSSDLSPDMLDNVEEDTEEIVDMMYLLNFAGNIN